MAGFIAYCVYLRVRRYFMSITYNKEIEILKLTNTSYNIDVFNFQYSPYSSYFEEIFGQLKRILIHESQKYKIDHPLLLFNNCTDVNASAISDSKNFILLLNSGLVVDTIGKTIENEKLVIFNEPFKITSKYLGITFEKLIFQYSILFTFYHEFAHFLQRATYISFLETEKLNHIDYQIVEEHFKEIDADNFSAIQLARHISEYCQKKIPQDVLRESIIGIAAIFIANLLYYLNRFPSSQKKLYFNENTHPHVYIRILNIIGMIARYINIDESLVEKNIKIKKEDLFEPIVDEVTRLQNVYENQNFEKFRDVITNETDLIVDYLNRIYDTGNPKIISAIDIYNKNIA